MKDSPPTTGGARTTAVIAAAPALTSVVPGTGPTTGGNTVTLNGSGFSGITAVMFGTKPALGYTVDSSTRITAAVPSGTGTVAVTVKTPGGTSNSVPYAYAAQPTLTAVSPSQGPSSGGTTVILTGTGFSGATAVTFGGTPASAYTVNSPTQITAVTPAGTGSVPVTVTGPGGISNSVIYTYVASPVLGSLTPDQGPVDSGAGATLTGSGLATTTAVHFGAASAAFTVLSDTSVAVLVPAGPSGPVPVNVTTLGGTSNSLVYTRIAAPTI